MTVRWKPLMILSGLFLVVALIGVVAITVAMMPKSAQGIVKLARAARDAGQFANAEIYYKKALQIEPRNPAIHEEFAVLYAAWEPKSEPEKRADRHAEWYSHMRQAAKYDQAARGPRRELLLDAMHQDLANDSKYWANELLSRAPEDLDAHYALGSEAVEEKTPNIPEVQKHLESLEKGKAPAIRRLWIRVRLADLVGNAALRAATIAESAAIPADALKDSVDRLAALRTTALALRTTDDAKALPGLAARLRTQIAAMGSPEDLPKERVDRLRALLEQTQWSLALRASKLPADQKKAVDAVVDAIEVDVESVFRQVLAEGHRPDVQLYYSYAAHLALRRKVEPCMEVVARGLKAAQTTKRPALLPVMGLHKIALDMILSGNDAGRFDKAAPHVQALLDAPEARYQAIGHMVAGSIDLDRSGIAAREAAEVKPAAEAKPAAEGQPAAKGDTEAPAVAKLRASALNHLRLAAAGLPDVAEAQAKYGVALVLSQEPNLGRQYLQTALRLGGLDAQYQLWAAWTILQAGYPEEAEPIVLAMLKEVEQGRLPAELAGTLHLLRGELYQARRSPEDLKRAADEFARARAGGQAISPTAEMRLAQLDVQLGHYDDALKRLQAIRARGEGGATADQLTILTLEEKGDRAAARDLLQKARKQYPHSADLVGIEASLFVKDGKPADADALLEKFLAAEPLNQTLAIMRAEILATYLKASDRARKLLESLAEPSESSAPLVQLAMLEIDLNRLDAASAVSARIRKRWKDSSAADILDAQIEIQRGRPDKAIALFDAALKKDPGNKVVLWRKAELEGRTGSVSQAARALEAIVRERPVKEVAAGTSLESAARSALATLSLQTRDYDDAIRRFEELRKSHANGALSRVDRWKLISAYINKGLWPQARSEIASILNDTKAPPTSDERVRGANYYRAQGENAAAQAQIDFVLKVEPTNPSAVVTRSYILIEENRAKEAASVLRGAIDRTIAEARGDAREKQAAAPTVFYLMLAVAESKSGTSAEALTQALKVLDEGLEAHPGSPQLIQARYLALNDAGRGDEALAFLEARANEDPKGPLRRMLVERLRERGQFDRAEPILVELHREFPDESNLAAAMVQIVSLRAGEAAARGRGEAARKLEERASAMIREFRSKYPTDPSFLQAECDMAARRGDYTQAIALTRDIDRIAKDSPVGPLLRVRLYSQLGRRDEVARAYGEAIDRERGALQLDHRLDLGRLRLELGDAEEAVRQASAVLAVDRNRIDAAVLLARGLAATSGSPSEQAARRRDAIARLTTLLKDNPGRGDIYQAMVDIHLAAGQRDQAIAVLKDEQKARPDDASAVGQLVQLFASSPRPGVEPTAADLAEADRFATEVASRDTKGTLTLAIASGFQRARQYARALPLARTAAQKLDTPPAHLALGELLLTIAESNDSGDASKPVFDEAIGEYDRVLKSVPDSIEAVNNKAWILHSYLHRSREALNLAKGLRERFAPMALPCEFLDTLGSIQESVGQTRDAEATYLEGLKKDDANPALNFHYGKLLATDPARAARARTYLRKALDGRSRLSPIMAREAEVLIAGPGPMRAN